MLVTLLLAALLTVVGTAAAAPFDTYGGGPLAVTAPTAALGLVASAPDDTYGGGPLH